MRSATGRALLQGSSFTRKQAHDERARLRNGTGPPIQRRSLPRPRSAALAVPTRTEREVQSSCGQACVIVLAETRSASAFRRRFCRPTPVGRRAWSVGPDPLPQGRLRRDFGGGADRPSQGRRRAVGPQPSDGSRRLGRRNMRAGAKAVSPMSSAYSSASEPDPKGQPHSGPSLN